MKRSSKIALVAAGLIGAAGLSFVLVGGMPGAGPALAQLPTGKAARYTGGLSVHKFTKIVTYERLTRRASREIGPVISRVCREEGMIAHAITGEVRVKRYEGAN